MLESKTARIRADFSFGQLLIIALAFFCIDSVQAKEMGVDITITNAYVEIHTGPGRGHPIFHVAEKNETITVLKKRTDWYKVETRTGQAGWVRIDDLHATLGPDGPVLVFARPDREAYENRKWEFGISSGDFAGARGLSTSVAYHMTSNLAAELRLTQAFGASSNSKLGSVNLVHQPWPHWYISPYFSLGLGSIIISPSSDLVQVEDLQDPALNVGGGLTFYFTRRFLVRLEYNDHKFLTTREENEEVEEWKAGISVFF